MRKTLMLGAALLSAAAVTPAQAAITLSTSAGSATYTGPTPTYDFESAAPLTGGQIVSGTNAAHTQPVGSSGSYAAFGPGNGGNGVLDLSSFGTINSISFVWGSLDSFNTLEFVDAANNVLASFNGGQVYSSSYVYATPAARTNPLVTFTLTGTSGAAVSALRFLSTRNGFEIDNVAVQAAATGAVPEPATWGMMMLGFAAVGFGLRRRKAAGLRLA